MEDDMFTLLADAMYAATLAKRGSNIPEHLKTHADRFVPEHERKQHPRNHPHNPYRDLW
jgi:hypothetical protein